MIIVLDEQLETILWEIGFFQVNDEIGFKSWYNITYRFVLRSGITKCIYNCGVMMLTGVV